MKTNDSVFHLISGTKIKKKEKGGWLGQMATFKCLTCGTVNCMSPISIFNTFFCYYRKKKREVGLLQNKRHLRDITKSHVWIFKKIFYLFILINLFLERGREGEREGEKHHCVVAFHTTWLGTWPATQACALSGIRTGNPLVHRPALSPLSHNIQGRFYLLFRERGREGEKHQCLRETFTCLSHAPN